MWERRYKDYPEDSTFKKESVEAGKGINGCEMKESVGWGLTRQQRKPSSGFLRAIFSLFFRIGGRS